LTLAFIFGLEVKLIKSISDITTATCVVVIFIAIFLYFKIDKVNSLLFDRLLSAT
jgi:hypothetical protein